MLFFLRRAGRNLEEAVRLGADAEWTQQETIETLGQHALQESAEWFWGRHSWPFEMPN